MELRYFVILQGDGIPIYAQSYNFASMESCITFDEKISDFNGNQIRSVIDEYFQVIRKISQANIMNEDLYLFDIGLSSYRITGINYNSYFFIGIFDSISNLDTGLALDKVKLFLRSIAINFCHKYQQELEKKALPDTRIFTSFTDEIDKICYDITRTHLNLTQCRNCLESCKYTHNNCIPHIIFFNNLEDINNTTLTKIEVEPSLSSNNIKKV